MKPISNTLYKTRYSFPFKEKEIKEIIIDDYSPKDLIVLEIEFLDENKINIIPEEFKKYIIRDITVISEFSNKKFTFEGTKYAY